MRKEIQIEGKWYWTLEATDQNQVFNPLEECYVWDCEGINKRIKTIFAIKTKNVVSPFVMACGSVWNHCALLSSEHEKKSRRCTNRELMKWCLKFGGFWLDEFKHVRLDIPNCGADHLTDSIPGFVASICTWDGEPMEPTAKNMGLEE